MTFIINGSFNKHLISWELIHLRLLHPSDSVMRSMLRHQNITGLPKHCPNKLNQAPFTIYSTAKMITLLEGTPVDTNKIQSV